MFDEALVNAADEFIQQMLAEYPKLMKYLEKVQKESEGDEHLQGVCARSVYVFLYAD